MADQSLRKTRARTRAIRARMAATGETYARAARHYDSARAERAAEAVAEAVPPPSVDVAPVVAHAERVQRENAAAVVQATYQARRRQVIPPPPATPEPPPAARNVLVATYAAVAAAQRRRAQVAPPVIFSSAPSVAAGAAGIGGAAGDVDEEDPHGAR